MKRINMIRSWIGVVLLVGLLLNACGAAVKEISSGVGEGEQEGEPGNNQGGTSGSQLGPCDAGIGFTAIEDRTGLEAIASDSSGNYCLTKSIDLAGKNWNPLDTFTGTLDGENHTISGLNIDDGADNGGLFRELGAGAIVKNLIVNQASVKGQVATGVLAGTSSGTIENLQIIGGTIEVASSTTLSPNAGGLVGVNAGVIENSYATSTVVGHNAGGLVGRNTDTGTIENSYASGGASGREVAGGLVGANAGTIENSYATSNVVGATVGGLVGFHYDGTIIHSYASGAVKGTATTTPIITGGLVGEISGTSNIIRSYFDTARTKQTKGIGQDANSQAANVRGLTETNILYFLGVSYDTGANPNIEILVDWDFAIWTFANKAWPTLAWQAP